MKNGIMTTGCMKFCSLLNLLKFFKLDKTPITELPLKILKIYLYGYFNNLKIGRSLILLEQLFVDRNLEGEVNVALRTAKVIEIFRLTEEGELLLLRTIDMKYRKLWVEGFRNNKLFITVFNEKCLTHYIEAEITLAAKGMIVMELLNE